MEQEAAGGEGGVRAGVGGVDGRGGGKQGAFFYRPWIWGHFCSSVNKQGTKLEQNIDCAVTNECTTDAGIKEAAGSAKNGRVSACHATPAVSRGARQGKLRAEREGGWCCPK